MPPVEEDPLLRDVDYSEAMSFVTIGLAATSPGCQADGLLSGISDQLWRASTVFEIARHARVRQWSWIDRPFHCWQLRQLLRDAQQAGDEHERLDRIARIFSMVHFGVDVSPRWFGRLRRVVARGLADEKELRKLLRSTCVLWRPLSLETKDRDQTLRWWQRLITLGSPSGGELRIQQPSWPFKLLVSLFFMALLACFGVGLADVVTRSLSGGRPVLTAGAASIMLVFGTAAWGVWWLGPGSWLKAKRLERLIASACRD